MGCNTSHRVAGAQLPSEELEKKQEAKSQVGTSSRLSIKSVARCLSVWACKDVCIQRHVFADVTVAQMLSGSSLRGELSLCLIQLLHYRGSRPTIWSHVRPDLIALEKLPFTVCVTYLVREAIRGTHLPHQCGITTLQQGGFCLKTLLWGKGLVCMQIPHCTRARSPCEVCTVELDQVQTCREETKHIWALLLHSLQVQSSCSEGTWVKTLPCANLKLLEFKFLPTDPDRDGT